MAFNNHNSITTIIYTCYSSYNEIKATTATMKQLAEHTIINFSDSIMLFACTIKISLPASLPPYNIT